MNEEESSETGNQIKSNNGAKINENKLAGYLSFRKQWNKLHLAAGLRYEHVSYKNTSKEGEDKSKTYNDLFPSAEAGYEVSGKLQTNLSFSR